MYPRTMVNSAYALTLFSSTKSLRKMPTLCCAMSWRTSTETLQQAGFSKIDLKSAYWQFSMSPNSIESTAFCPGPEYGLWKFTLMPYWLNGHGTTQNCQRGLDKVLKNCKHCVDNYIDDCIVFSDDMQSHVTDFHCVLSKLLNAGFTLWGSQCSFG